MDKRSITEKDLKYNWHPFTQMKDCLESPPIPIDRAEGIKLYDMDGKSYYDTISSWWCNIHGHGHPHIKKAVISQLDRLEHTLFAGFTHEPAVALSERLVDITPKGLEKVFYSDNGSTSVEVALKMSYQYWKNKGIKGKTKFISLDKAYHGDTLGAMSVSGPGAYTDTFKDLFFDVYNVPTPDCNNCPLRQKRGTCLTRCVEYVDDILEDNADNISAIILEPILMGAGGMIIYPAEYLEKVSFLAKRYDVHLILDEVASGFGRTGRMFACEHANVTPDLMCISKGITSGYLPMGATLATEDIYEAFYADHHENKTFYHGHTYTANPLSCAAANACLDIFESDEPLANVALIEKGISDFMTGISGSSIVKNTRNIGVVGAFDIHIPEKNNNSFAGKGRIGYDIYRYALGKGLLLRPLGDTVYFFLPLSVKKSELDDIFNKTSEVIRHFDDTLNK